MQIKKKTLSQVAIVSWNMNYFIGSTDMVFKLLNIYNNLLCDYKLNNFSRN